MSTGNAVRVLKVEELEGLYEEAHDNGTHEKGTGAAQQACHRHDLHCVVCE